MVLHVMHASGSLCLSYILWLVLPHSWRRGTCVLCTAARLFNASWSHTARRCGGAAGGAVKPLSIDSKCSTKQHTQASAAAASSSRGITIRNVERRHWAQPWRKNPEQLQEPVCSLDLPEAAKGWKGPRLKLSLPSFRYAHSLPKNRTNIDQRVMCMVLFCVILLTGR